MAATSLRYDRDVKGPLYARAGIVEYCLVDLTGGPSHACGAGGRDVSRGHCAPEWRIDLAALIIVGVDDLF